MSELVAALLRPGGVVALPTSTLYGLSGRASDEASALRIARLKQRPPGPLILLVDGIPEGMTGLARELAEAFWPGPLTLLVENPGLEIAALHASPLVALRWDPHEALSPLIRRVGPLTSTSINRTGEPPLRDLAALDLAVDAVLDVGPLPEGPPSTLVHVPERRVLRAGANHAAVAQALAAV